MQEIFVIRDSELKEGDRRIVRSGDQSFGVMRVDGTLYAFLNLCPHQGGPVCEGMLMHQAEEIIADDKTYQGMRFTSQANIVCPWHGWEFNVATGRSAGDSRWTLRKVQLTVRDGGIYVQI